LALDVHAVFAHHGHVVLRRARHILGSDSDAEDVVQEIFMAMMEHPERFRGESSMTTYLYRVTTNHCLNRLRNQARRAVLDGAMMEGFDDTASATAPMTFDAKRVLARLPERLAQVAVHYYIDEMTHEEIAHVLGVSRRMVGKLVTQLQQEVAP
jgi:RNA polymerase sigma factor (sigma-70 family)